MLYVELELVTFAAVVCLDGRAETLQAAPRYLLFALLGSTLYLVGTALLYGTYGTLDIVLLSQRIGEQPATHVAVALMWASCQDRAFPAVSLAAAGPRWRACLRERGALGVGCEGIFLHRGIGSGSM